MVPGGVELELMIRLQAVLGWLEPGMRLVSALGYTQVYLLAAAAIYWWARPGLGLRLGLLLCLGGALTDILKLAARAPRPAWIDPRVQALTRARSFGLPSGHALTAWLMWGYPALKGARPKPLWGWPLGLGLIFVIGWSRVQLGVHSPLQVLAGWLGGGALVLAAAKWEPGLRAWLRGQGPLRQVALGLALSLSLLAAGAVIRAGLGGWAAPAGWRPGPGFDPLRLEPILVYTGLLGGLAGGAVLMNLKGGFDPTGPWAAKVGRLALGLAGGLLIRLAPALWPGPGAGIFLSGLVHYLAGLGGGLWIAWLAPVLFIRLGLAGSGSGEPGVGRE